jgi:hypothetical protein
VAGVTGKTSAHRRRLTSRDSAASQSPSVCSHRSRPAQLTARNRVSEPAPSPPEITEQVSGLVFAHTSQLARSSGLRTAWLPATRAIRTVHPHRPDTVALAYSAMLDMIDREGWTPAGPVIEEYLSLDVSPAATPSIRLTVPIT